MEFDATFLFSVISFIVFVFIMNAIFYAPILKIMQKRSSLVENNFNSANKLKEQTKIQEDYHSNELEKFRTIASSELNSSMQRINSEKSKIIAQYKSELVLENQNKKEELRHSALDAKETLKNSVVDIAKNISNILFGADIDSNTINKSQIKEE